MEDHPRLWKKYMQIKRRHELEGKSKRRHILEGKNKMHNNKKSKQNIKFKIKTTKTSRQALSSWPSARILGCHIVKEC